MKFGLGFGTGLLVAAILVAILVGCDSGSKLTGPSSTQNWHGNKVIGYQVLETTKALEQAWPAVSQRFPSWSPVGWTILSHESPFPCPELGICEGRMIGPAREIHVGWKNEGFKRVVEVAKWELCNAARWELSKRPKKAVDEGCGR